VFEEDTNPSCIHKEIKIILIRGIFATIQFRIFSHPVSCLNTQD